MKKISFHAARPLSSRRPLRLAFFFILSLSLAVATAFLFSAATAEASKGVQKRRQQQQATKRRAAAPRPRRDAKAAPAAAKSREKTAEGIDAPTIGDEEDGDEREVIDARQQWFMMQRAYPFGTPPAEGRLKAWLARPKDAGRGKDGGLDTRSVAQAWRSIGPSPTTPAFPNNWGVTSGRLNSIAVHPTAPHIILIGAATGGIWRSTDSGLNFVPVSDTHVDLAVGSIAFSRSNPSVVYAGMGDLDNGYFGTGVLKSTDAGATWTRVSNNTLPPLGTTAEIEVDPTNPNRVYALQATRTMATSYDNLNPDGTLYRNGFYVSTDGGVNWQRTLRGRPRDIAIHPTNPQILYVGMSLVDVADGVTGPAGVYKSLDGGATWLPAPVFTATTANLSDVRLAVTPAAPDRIYVISGSRTSIRVDVGDNGGLLWTNKPVSTVDPGQFGYNAYIYVHPNDANTIYVGTRDVYKTTDGGASWTNLSKNFGHNPSNTNNPFPFNPFNSNTHPDQHAFAFDPHQPNTIYVGNDGGLSRSTDGGQTFASLNASLTLTQFVGISMHPTNPSISYGGTQDNGTQLRVVGTNTWREFSEGDGGRSIVNAANPSTVFTTYVYGKISRYGNNGASGRTVIAENSTFGEPATGQRIAFYPPMVGNGVDSTIYFGTWRLFTCTTCEATPNWTAPAGTDDLTKGSTPQGPDVLSAIGVERRANAQIIYTGSAQGRVMVSTNGGINWTDRSTGLPNRFVESITVDPSNAAVAYITYGGFGTGHVYRTTDFGGAWTDIGGTPGQATAIPNVPVSAFLIDPTNPTTLYAGSDIGVFRSTDNGATWATFNNGMLPAVVTGFATSAGGAIQLSTYGRGAYELTGTASYTISGSIRNAIATPFSGVTVTLSGAQSATVTTDAQGNYSFPNLPAGNYTVTPTRNLYTFAPTSHTYTNLSANQTANFTISEGRYSLSGRIATANGGALAGVSVSLNGAPGGTTATDANGFYAFDNLIAGSNYVVTPAKANYTFTPANAVVSNISANRTGVNFTGASSCAYSVVPGSTQSFPASGGTGSFQIVTSAGCAWTASSLAPSWLSITNANGTGSGTVTFNVAANAGAARTGQILHTDDSFYNIVQAGSASPTVIEFAAPSSQFGEAAGRASINVTRTGNLSGVATVDYRTADTDTFTVGCADRVNNGGGAYARCDFATTVGSLSFAPGEATKTITVPLIDDGHAEGAETFQLRLSNASGAALNPANIPAVVTILDNDAPGTANPIFSSPFFVRQQYLDFLSREPDEDGFNAWLRVLNNCSDVNNNSVCDRSTVSAAFFRSQEFQVKGLYVFRFYKLAFNRLPEYAEIVSDMSFVAGATEAEVYARKAQLAQLFTERQEFQAAYGGLSNAQYVAALFERYGLTQVLTPDPAAPDGTQKLTLASADLTNRLTAGTLTRAQVMRAVADSDAVGAREFNNAFVAMQYYGYLRRKPEPDGYAAWLRVLQSGDIRTMVGGFMNSSEYRARFGQ